jgi:hypothetical protein
MSNQIIYIYKIYLNNLNKSHVSVLIRHIRTTKKGHDTHRQKEIISIIIFVNNIS